MIIHIDKNGGFAGVSKHMEVNTDNIGKPEAVRLKKILRDEVVKKYGRKSKKKALQGAADYYIFRITFNEGNKQHVIKCDELEMHNELKELIKYVERMSKKSNLKIKT